MTTRCLLQNLTRNPKGQVIQRGQTVTGELLRIGRGAECEIQLSDPRVRQHHAELALRDGSLWLHPHGNADVFINGTLSQGEKLATGDTLHIGPYELVVIATSDKEDVSLSLELIHPLDNSQPTEGGAASVSIDRIILSKRGWAWFMFLLVLGLSVLWPLLDRMDSALLPSLKGKLHTVDQTAERFLMTGEISPGHRFFGNNCQACHKVSFESVADKTCLSCHEKIKPHAKAGRTQEVGLEKKTCAWCHQEHETDKEILARRLDTCESCHGKSLPDRAAGEWDPVTAFHTDHPQFHAFVNASGGRTESVALLPDTAARFPSTLKYPHDKHLVEKGVRHPEKGQVKLECGNCHKAEPVTGEFQPITFEGQCRECHRLNFDPALPQRELPHGRLEKVKQFIDDTYLATALLDASAGQPEEQENSDARRRPGKLAKDLTRAKKMAAIDWARQKARETLAGKFGKGLCGECHQILEDSGPKGWSVVVPVVTRDWFPHTRFRHSRHDQVACINCHEAPKSNSADDILLPGIATCRTCHGGEEATARVPSSCLTCHDYHERKAGDEPPPGIR